MVRCEGKEKKSSGEGLYGEGSNRGKPKRKVTKGKVSLKEGIMTLVTWSVIIVRRKGIFK